MTQEVHRYGKVCAAIDRHEKVLIDVPRRMVGCEIVRPRRFHGHIVTNGGVGSNATPAIVGDLRPVTVEAFHNLDFRSVGCGGERRRRDRHRAVGASGDGRRW